MNWRRLKRTQRKAGMSDMVLQAWYEGEAAGWSDCPDLPPRLQTNPYPPGRRHDEYERGRNLPRKEVP